MATEEPQTLPVDQKTKGSEEVKDVAVDDPTAPVVNGHAKPDESKIEEPTTATTTADGDKTNSTSPIITKESQNQQAFAANNNLPEQTLSLSPSKKEAPDAPEVPAAIEAPKTTETTEDIEMKDANGAPTEEKEHPSADTASEKHDAGSATKETSSSIPAAPKDEETAKSKSTPEPVVDEKMDVDTAEPAANTPSKDEPASATEDAKATQSTEATQDTETAQDETATDPPAVSPKSSAQLPDKEPSPTSKPENEQARDSRAGSPAKVSRTREDDNSDEPASKRVKIGDSAVPAADSLVVANGPSPAPQDATASADESVPDDKPIAPYQNKLIRAHLASLKKTKNGQHFRQSVEKMWPILWPDYRQKVHEPIDLSMLEAKFREDAYKTYGEFKAKVQLLYNNALAFNGPEHAITASAAIVRDQILAKLPELDKMEEPVKPEKGKTQPTRHTEPRSATQARRQSQPQTSQAAATPKPKPKPETVSVTAPAAPPTPSSTAPTFALPPNGIPQIRRDSTREDGDRPKRPIHPPKNRDLDYNSKVNRKKKLDPEQRFHDEVLNKIKKGTYFHMNQWFMEPVDPVALNIPTYFSVVKKPMDLSTMTRKNLDGHYKSTKDLEKDMRLIVHNAEQFNGPDHEVTVLGKSLEELFKEELAKKDEWMSQHYPQDEPAPASASAASPERSAPETEEESEAEGGDDTNDAIRNLQHRLNEEQGKLNSWLNSKKPDPVMIEVQQQMVQMIQKKLVEEKNKFHGEAKKPKPKKKNPKSKPKPSSSATASSATKKSAPSHAAATTKKSSAGSSKKAGPKKRTIGQLEKAVIEEGISTLDGNTLTKAVEIIKKDTGQNENDDGEMELDIESLSPDALGRLYDLIHKAHPHIRSSVEKRQEFAEQANLPSPEEPKTKSTAPPKPKKNKPMNKHEQERKIEQLRELKAQLARQGSGSQEPPPTSAENQVNESSEEESDSEEE